MMNNKSFNKLYEMLETMFIRKKETKTIDRMFRLLDDIEDELDYKDRKIENLESYIDDLLERIEEGRRGL